MIGLGKTWGVLYINLLQKAVNNNENKCNSKDESKYIV